MRLSNGLDKCSGQLEMKSSDSWGGMRLSDWSKKNSDMVCQHLGCGESKNLDSSGFVKSNLPLLQLKLTCTGSSITQCSLSQQRDHQKNLVAVDIICNSMGFSTLHFLV